MTSVSGLPSGTVTFLFTDIEGSTRLLKTLGASYDEVLQTHNRLLREAFAAHDGHEIDTQGDSFFVAFRRGRDAIAAAVDSQRALADHGWPDGARSRCGWESTPANRRLVTTATSESACIGQPGSVRPGTAGRSCSRARRTIWSKTTCRRTSRCVISGASA